MGECETRTQGAFVAGGYGRDRGRRIAPPSAAEQPVLRSERSVYASETTQIAAASSRECVIERSIAPALVHSAHSFVRPERRTPGFGRPAISISFHVKRTPIPSAFPIASLPAKR